MAKRIRKKRKAAETERIELAQKQREDAIRFKEDYLDEHVSEKQLERKAKRDKEQAERLAKQKSPEEIAAAKKHRLIILGGVLLLLTAIALVASSAVLVLDLEAEKKEAQERLDAVTKNRDQLQEELESVYSSEYVEQEARSELRMIYPGETLYILNNNDAEKAPKEDEDVKAKPDEKPSAD